MKYKNARLLQLSYAVYSLDGTLIKEVNRYVRPSDFAIPADSTKIHGITDEYAKKHGEPLQVILRDLEKEICGTYMIVGHNVAFDRLILQSEAWRNGSGEFAMMMEQIPWACTMRAGISICGGEKWPRLGELHRVVCGGDFGATQGAHNALEDVRATARCWLAMRKAGIML
jgi:DNA polymerase III epsilon subunit-like protein